MMNEANPIDWAPPHGMPRPLPPPTVIKGGSGPFTNTFGYDLTDYNSWPYGFGSPDSDVHEADEYGPARDFRNINDCLLLDPSTEERLAEIDCMELLANFITKNYDDDGPSEARMLDMALRLFLHLCTAPQFNGAFDPRINGLSHTDIFGACLDTAIVWELG